MAKRRPRPLRFFAFAVAVAVVLAAGQIAFVHLRERAITPAAGSCWIWRPGSFEKGSPTAFYAFGEVDLTHLPNRAQVLVTADEDYRLYINDHWVGGGRYTAGAGIDAYEVGARLQTGRNRLVLELRSSRGAGGLLASLVAGDGSPLLVTDESWRIVERYDPALLRFDQPVEKSMPARVWGSLRSGRWRIGGRPITRIPWFCVSRALQPIVPSRGLLPDSGARWRRIADGRQRLPRALSGERVIFDWGREVEGVPVIDLRESSATLAVISLATRIEDLQPPAHERTFQLMMPIEGAPFWLGDAPRRFRYLEIVGTRLRRRPFVLEAAEGVEVADFPLPGIERAGVFGLPALWHPSRAKKAVLDRTVGVP